MQLQNRRCVVTGAASGIGEAIALLFAGEGARLILTDRDRNKLEGVVQRCRLIGAHCYGVVADVGEVDGATAGVDACLGTMKGLTCWSTMQPCLPRLPAPISLWICGKP